MAAKISSANVQRDNPYRNFQFQVVIDGRPVAGLSKMEALNKTTEVVDSRTAYDPSCQHNLPGKTTYSSVSFEQGLSHDPVFEQWINAVDTVAAGDASTILKDFRCDIVIISMDPKGGPVVSYQLRRAWVTECTLQPQPDADSMNTVMIESIRIACDGFVRDDALPEPTET